MYIPIQRLSYRCHHYIISEGVDSKQMCDSVKYHVTVYIIGREVGERRWRGEGLLSINGGGVVVANGRGNIGDCFPILPSSVVCGEDTTPNDIAIQYYNDNDVELACGKNYA